MKRRWIVVALHATTKYAHGSAVDGETMQHLTWICSGIGLIVRDRITGGILESVPAGLRRAINIARKSAVEAHIAKLTEARGGD